YHEENQRLAGLEVRQQMIGQGFYAIVQSFLSITPAAVYLITGLLLARNTAISAGTIVAFMRCARRRREPSPRPCVSQGTKITDIGLPPAAATHRPHRRGGAWCWPAGGCPAGGTLRVRRSVSREQIRASSLAMSEPVPGETGEL